MAQCRRGYQAVADQADIRVLRAETVQLMALLADPAH
jgi:hypothetical protein